MYWRWLLMKRLHSLVLSTSILCFPLISQADDTKQVYIYNWSDYIAEDTLQNFEKKTGIKAQYDVFDSNEILEAKLLSGKTGYDVVVPSHDFLRVQIRAGAFQPLDKSKLPNLKNLDSDMMKEISATIDPDNKFAIPYLLATTGFGYNPEKVKAVLGDDAPVKSWRLLLDEKNLAKLKSCGVAFLDAPTEVFPIVLNYLGKNPNTQNLNDYKEAVKLLEKLSPHVTYFHSSKYISDLANGDICVAIGWSGDMYQAADRAAEAKNGINIRYNIPEEGAPISFDMLAIPKDATHSEAAHAFLNYLMEPKVIANITNYVKYANPNVESKSFIDADILKDPGIYPTEKAKRKLFTFGERSKSVQRFINRAWTRIKTGK